MFKQLIASAAIVLTFVMYVPYIRSIHRGRTKPHAFSWIIWTLSALVVCFAQLSDEAGAGAWPIGVAGLITAYIAFLAYRNHADKSITHTDWVCMSIAIAALMSWLVTSNPLLAVILLTGVELAGFGPTFRFASSHPHDERMWFFTVGSVRNMMVIAALENYTLTTVTFPAAKAIVSAMLVATIWFCRFRLPLRENSGGSA